MPIANIVVPDFYALWNSVLFVYTVCLYYKNYYQIYYLKCNVAL